MNSFQSAITWSWGRLRLRPERWMHIAATLVAISAVAAPWRVEAAGRVALVLVGEDYVKLQKSIIGARRANDIADALTERQERHQKSG